MVTWKKNLTTFMTLNSLVQHATKNIYIYILIYIE